VSMAGNKIKFLRIALVFFISCFACIGAMIESYSIDELRNPKRITMFNKSDRTLIVTVENKKENTQYCYTIKTGNEKNIIIFPGDFVANIKEKISDKIQIVYELHNFVFPKKKKYILTTFWDDEHVEGAWKSSTIRCTRILELSLPRKKVKKRKPIWFCATYYLEKKIDLF